MASRPSAQAPGRYHRAPCILLLGLVALPMTLGAQATDPALAHARRLLAGTILIDGHNDLPWEIRTQKDTPGDVVAYDLRGHTKGYTDLARLAAGQVGAQFWSIYIPGEIRDSGYARVQLEQFDIARRMIAKYPERLVLALTADDIVRAKRQKKIASLLGMEGGHAIENSLGALRVVLRPRRALHDAHPQRDARLGRRRARHREARRPHAVRPGGRARDEPARHARRPLPRLAGRDEQRARRRRRPR